MIHWRGKVAWDGRAFYALTRDGKRRRRPPIRLVSVTRPDGSHFYRIALPWQKSPPPGRIVSLDVDLYGKGDIAA